MMRKVQIFLFVLMLGLVTTVGIDEVSSQPVWKGGKLQPLTDGYPDAAITLWNQNKPGHSDELYARAMAMAAKDLSPVPFSVESSSTSVAQTFGILRKIKTLPRYKEGYQIVSAAIAPIGVHNWTVDRGKFTLDDLKMIISTESYPLCIVSRTDAPWKTLPQLLEYSKANPGKVRYGMAPGARVRLQMALLAKAAGVDWLFVPHASLGEAILSVLGGGIELTNTNFTQVKSYVQEGRLRVLAQFTEERSKTLPNVPTVPELGYTDVAAFGGARGFWTCSEVPDTHISWLYELFKKASEQPVYQQRIKKLELDYVIRDGKWLMSAVKDSSKSVGPLIKALGLAAKQK